MSTPLYPMQRAFTRRSSRLVAAAAVLGVCFLSFLPLRDKRRLHTKGELHLWGHAFIFGALAFVVVRAAQSWKTRLLALMGVLALGCGIEYAQHVINHEPLERADVVTDSISIVVGFLGAMWSAPVTASEEAE